jgi:hypothetical protein
MLKPSDTLIQWLATRLRTRRGVGGRQASRRGHAATQVISDRDVWQAALLIVKRYGDDAMFDAGH